MTKKKNKKNHKIPTLTIGFIMAVSGLLATQIVLSNRLATEGKTLNLLEEKIELLSKENMRLRAEKAEVVSLSKTSETAQAGGFVNNPPFLTFSQEKAVALKP